MRMQLVHNVYAWYGGGMPEKPLTPKLRGRRRPIPLALLPELVAELDRLAAAELRSRGMLIEVLIRKALAVRQSAHRKRHAA